jgi:hypothetical protein
MQAHCMKNNQQQSIKRLRAKNKHSESKWHRENNGDDPMNVRISGEGESEKCDGAYDSATETFDEMCFWWGLLPQLLGHVDVVSYEQRVA